MRQPEECVITNNFDRVLVKEVTNDFSVISPIHQAEACSSTQLYGIEYTSCQFGHVVKLQAPNIYLTINFCLLWAGFCIITNLILWTIQICCELKWDDLNEAQISEL